MKKFKKLIIAILVATFIFLPFGFVKVKAEEDRKVKVYVFVAGGCGYCELEMEYLKGLDSYGEKFVVVEKELYVDNQTWAEGKDYELGEVVASEFYNAGFTSANTNGTPFVVISDIYAATAYSESLEDYIDQAYNEGDKDVVGCIENGGDQCLAGGSTKKDVTVKNVLLIIFIAGVVCFLIFGNKNTEEDDYDDERDYDDDERDYDDDEDDEEEYEEPKKEKKVVETSSKKKHQDKHRSKSKKKK